MFLKVSLKSPDLKTVLISRDLNSLNKDLDLFNNKGFIRHYLRAIKMSSEEFSLNFS